MARAPLVDAVLPHPIYMTHRAWRDTSLDRRDKMYYRIVVSLDADEVTLLDDVKDVLYKLHPTFVNPERLATDRRTSFALYTAAWGEFNMTAEIHFSNRPSLVVERYINFPCGTR